MKRLLIVCLLLIVILIYCLYLSVKKNIKANEQTEKAVELYKQGVENEKAKETMYSGDSRSDFDNSINILQNLKS